MSTNPTLSLNEVLGGAAALAPLGRETTPEQQAQGSKRREWLRNGGYMLGGAVISMVAHTALVLTLPTTAPVLALAAASVGTSGAIAGLWRAFKLRRDAKRDGQPVPSFREAMKSKEANRATLFSALGGSLFQGLNMQFDLGHKIADGMQAVGHKITDAFNAMSMDVRAEMLPLSQPVIDARLSPDYIGHPQPSIDARLIDGYMGHPDAGIDARLMDGYIGHPQPEVPQGGGVVQTALKVDAAPPKAEDLSWLPKEHSQPPAPIEDKAFTPLAPQEASAPDDLINQLATQNDLPVDPADDPVQLASAAPTPMPVATETQGINLLPEPEMAAPVADPVDVQAIEGATTSPEAVPQSVEPQQEVDAPAQPVAAPLPADPYEAAAEGGKKIAECTVREPLHNQFGDLPSYMQPASSGADVELNVTCKKFAEVAQPGDYVQWDIRYENIRHGFDAFEARTVKEVIPGPTADFIESAWKDVTSKTMRMINPKNAVHAFL
jgi:hypothetical protein